MPQMAPTLWNLMSLSLTLFLFLLMIMIYTTKDIKTNVDSFLKIKQAEKSWKW